MANRESLYLPALRSQMGDRIYYISFMSMKDVTERVSLAGEIHKSEQLNALIQRQLSELASARQKLKAICLSKTNDFSELSSLEYTEDIPSELN